jgi:hypothetical protein
MIALLWFFLTQPSDTPEAASLHKEEQSGTSWRRQ